MTGTVDIPVSPVTAASCSAWLKRAINRHLKHGRSEFQFDTTQISWSSDESQCAYQDGIDESQIYGENPNLEYINRILSVDAACATVTCAEDWSPMADLVRSQCNNGTALNALRLSVRTCRNSTDPDGVCDTGGTHFATFLCEGSSQQRSVNFNFTGGCSKANLIPNFSGQIDLYCQNFERTVGPYLCISTGKRTPFDTVNLAFAAGSAFAIFFTPVLKVLHDWCNPEVSRTKSMMEMQSST